MNELVRRSLGLHLNRFEAAVAEGAPRLGWKVAFKCPIFAVSIDGIGAVSLPLEG